MNENKIFEHELDFFNRIMTYLKQNIHEQENAIYILELKLEDKGYYSDYSYIKAEIGQRRNNLSYLNYMLLLVEADKKRIEDKNKTYFQVKM